MTLESLLFYAALPGIVLAGIGIAFVCAAAWGIAVCDEAKKESEE